MRWRGEFCAGEIYNVDGCVMKVDGRHFRSIWLEPDGWSIGAVDQRKLPHDFAVVRLTTCDAAADEMRSVLRHLPPSQRAAVAYSRAGKIAEEDIAINKGIGHHGLALIEAIAARKKPGERVNVLTHCNAGWLATVDWGTATAPIYLAHDRGHAVHVWVDETRPRNQGASLTAWELGHHGVPHTVIPDSTGGHLMQHGMVDLVIVGTDRVTANGDVCNKIGTYLKALAAHDNGVPFYVALPSPTIDFSVDDGIKQGPIEQRAADEA